MKQAVLLLGLLLSATLAFSHPNRKDFDYSIVFGGCFDEDIVSLSINNVTVFDRYRVDNGDAVQKGHLSLTQTPEGITIYYNGTQTTRRSVVVDHTLDIEVRINGKTEQLRVDLRKGKVVVLDRCPGTEAISATALKVEQIQEPMMLL